MKHLQLLIFALAAGIGYAQVPTEIKAGLQKIGHILDSSCTAKLYRPLMPKNNISSGVTPLLGIPTKMNARSRGKPNGIPG